MENNANRLTPERIELPGGYNWQRQAISRDTGKVYGFLCFPDGKNIGVMYEEEAMAMAAAMTPPPPAADVREFVEEWEYETTTGPRKAWSDENRPPEGEGWERDTSRGDNGWERFDYHEEAYWKRLKPKATPSGEGTVPEKVSAAMRHPGVAMAMAVQAGTVPVGRSAEAEKAIACLDEICVGRDVDQHWDLIRPYIAQLEAAKRPLNVMSASVCDPEAQYQIDHLKERIAELEAAAPQPKRDGEGG